jgi:hypothetical protein
MQVFELAEKRINSCVKRERAVSLQILYRMRNDTLGLWRGFESPELQIRAFGQTTGPTVTQDYDR